MANDKKDQKQHRDRKNLRSADIHKEQKKAKNADRPKQMFVNGQWTRWTMPEFVGLNYKNE